MKTLIIANTTLAAGFALGFALGMDHDKVRSARLTESSVQLVALKDENAKLRRVGNALANQNVKLVDALERQEAKK